MNDMGDTAGQGRRSQAERDAITVEIGYALASATAAAVLVFMAVAGGPVLVFGLSGGLAETLTGVGVTLAAVVFLVRLVTVLWRFADRLRGRRAAAAGAPPQPSQPGRTSPDS
ncbi:hypothetical protein GCM10018785_58600 [Streptomyces longispororuber]|uniref:Uncharacterized protein n=1 Tax=Streptomyces longispororuber TaxID=68230 RepID=A0A919A2N0_9ACTN|nr:DUF6332 family protein [Streptomyces longispororuber]GHE82899.1 hypothetical protein GCM10018785_58600 [Streptomyces longispororuber]